ncbi:MAG: OmpH family outer membrane protein, partial [Candidatus Electrothrix sp. AR3]|nr:OmpH family outer membrane protein [Candidatus Electrothrix sp. AR3]
DDANLEMKKIQDKHLAPIMKKLEPIVKQVAQSQGISVVLPNNAVIYFDDAMDITAEVTNKLNKGF